MNEQNIITIPCPPDEITLNLIKKAEMFKKHAISHAGYGSELDCMIAIHNLDNCIEYLLRISTGFLKIETIEGKTLNNSDISSLAGELNSFLKKHYQINLPYFEEIKIIRQIRNLVQHGMVNPNAELKRLIAITNNFFEKLLGKIFGMTGDAIKTSVLINDKEICEYIDAAENYIEEGKYLNSIVSSRDAFENSIYKRLEILDLKNSSIPAILNEQNNKYFIYYLEKITEQLLAIQLNLNLKYYYKFKNYMDYIPLEYCRGNNSSRVLGRDWNKDDALFCFHYVCDELLKWQYEDKEAIEVGKFSFENNTTWKYTINSYSFENNSVGCMYIFSGDDRMDLMYIQDEEFNDFNNIEVGKNYSYKTEVYENGKINKIIENEIHLLGYKKNVITNNPLRWEVVIWYKENMLSYKNTEYHEENIITSPVDINNATADDIINLDVELFNKEIAEIIVNYIKAIGGLKNLDDLKQISGITEDQINCIGNSTHI